MKNMLVLGLLALCLVGCRTFAMAVIDQNFEEAETFVKAGEDVNAPDHTGTTPLLYAAGYGHPAMVRWLLDKGADPNGRHAFTGETPLLSAAYYGNLAVVKILVERGADINIKSRNGYNALEYARKYNFAEVEKILLENGAMPIY